MSIAFVLGNGVSRRGLDLSELQSNGPVYGCNALYREFTPDALIATDRPISEQIQQSGYALKHRFYTRTPMEGLGAYPVIEQYWGFSSGPLAIAHAVADQNRKIYMLGFDMGPANDKFNNVYADTEFYKTSNSVPTFTGNWVNQIAQLANDYSTVEFIRVQGETTAEIPQLKNIINLKHLPLLEFQNRINNKKDL
jgi:hypothetical protein